MDAIRASTVIGMFGLQPLQRARIGMLFGALVAAAVGCKGQAPAPMASAEPAAASSAPTAPPPPEKTPLQLANEKIQAAPRLDAALAIAKPMMGDSVQAPSDGALILTLWAGKHATLVDFKVTKDETSFALVQKDSDPERGKRVCVSGSIVEIRKEKMPAAFEGTLFTGEVLSANSNVWHYYAVGSTGALVASSPARLCGVVTGKYDYAGSNSNTVHAVDVVGMFDIPENRK